MAPRQCIKAALLNSMATAMTVSAALAGLIATEATAEPRAGAPIVFANQRAPARSTPVHVAEPPARLQTVSASASTRRSAPESTDQPDVLYGYGSRRARNGAPPIDLRGTLASSAQAGSLGDDAFDNAYEPVGATSEGARAQERDAMARQEDEAMASPEQTEPTPPQTRPQSRPQSRPHSRPQTRPQTRAQTRPDWLEQERTGAPYQANDQWFVPTAEPNYSETGSASWYGAEFHGRRTASGEIFDSEALTGSRGPQMLRPAQVGREASAHEVDEVLAVVVFVELHNEGGIQHVIHWPPPYLSSKVGRFLGLMLR